jgi:hypothetical protein
MSLVALCLMVSLQAATRADSFHRAAISGRYHLASPYATAFNVNATSSFFSSTGVTVPSGSITILSNDGLYIYAGVASLVTDTVNIGGTNYKHATVVSKPFMFNGSKAHVMIETTQHGVYGDVGFQIIRDSDNAMLQASWPDGFYQQLPMEYGGVTIL